MKVGEKYKVVKSFACEFGSFPASPPWKDELIEVTEKNINDMELQLRAGNIEELGKASNEASRVLSNVKIGRRNRRSDIQPEDEPTV